MGVHPWKDLQHKMGTARRKELQREVEQEIQQSQVKVRIPSGEATTTPAGGKGLWDTNA